MQSSTESGLYRRPPFEIVNPQGKSPVLLVCEHASRYIPEELAQLGLDDAAAAEHIAWDIGVSALSQYLSRTLDAPLFMTNYSRLVIDCNRPLDAPSAIPDISEATEIPGNIDLSAPEREQRIKTLFTPYANAIARRLDLLQSQGKRPIVIGIHSFTPVYLGRQRPWHAGILYGAAAGFGQTLIRELRGEGDLTIGDNEPYTIHPDEDYTVPVHADARGLDGALIEVRHDLIDTLAGVDAWGDRLTRCLLAASKEHG